MYKYLFSRIGLKEKELEDANFAAKELTAKNEEFKKRVTRLKETRNYHLQKAIKDNRKFLNDVDNEPKCTKEDVLLELEKSWLHKKSEEDKLRGSLIIT
jgi:vacuolar-type H+-ATPase subunit H